MREDIAGGPSARPQKHVPGNPAGYHVIVATEAATKGKNDEVAMMVAMAATATEIYIINGIYQYLGISGRYAYQNSTIFFIDAQR